MKIKILKPTVCLLIALALCFGLDLPRFLLPDWSYLARMALDAGGQLLCFAAMAVLALWAEPILAERKDPAQHS